ncbi:MAG TPA: hypothetical protein VI636_09655 [Candidatus Angelobacter sp.]
MVKSALIPKPGDILQSGYWPESVQVMKAMKRTVSFEGQDAASLLRVFEIVELESVGVNTKTIYCNILDPFAEHATDGSLEVHGQRKIYLRAIFSGEFDSEVTITGTVLEEKPSVAERLRLFLRKDSVGTILLLSGLFGIVVLIPAKAGWYGQGSRPFRQLNWVLVGGILSGFLTALILYGWNKRSQRRNVLEKLLGMAWNFRAACRHRADLFREWEHYFESDYRFLRNHANSDEITFADAITFPLWWFCLSAVALRYRLIPKGFMLFVICVLLVAVRYNYRQLGELKGQIEVATSRLKSLRAKCDAKPQFLNVWREFNDNVDEVLFLTQALCKESYWTDFF